MTKKTIGQHLVAGMQAKGAQNHVWPEQPSPVVMPDGSEYEFDTWDMQYHCIHANVRIEQVEVDTMRNGEHDTYEVPAAICENPECEEDITENYDFSPDYDPDDYDPDR